MGRPDSPIACNLGAIPAHRRARYEELLGRIRMATGEMLILPDGYALRLDAEPGRLAEIAEWIGFERACCPFIRFSLDVEPNDGPLWLRLTGAPGVREFLGVMLRPPDPNAPHA